MATSSDENRHASEGTTIFTLPFYEDSGTMSLSKVTAPYPMSNDDYGSMQTSMDGEKRHSTDFLQWKQAESVSGKNASTDHHNLSQYLKPLSQFTLPSLPQFGIKVVSAAETTLTSRAVFEAKRKKTKTYQAMSTSFSGVTPSFLASSTSLVDTAARKFPMESHRKAPKWPSKTSNNSVTSNIPGNIESTISPVPMGSTTTKTFPKIPNASNAKLFSPSPVTSVFKSTNAAKVATNLAPTLPGYPSIPTAPDDEKATKYSVKTTRDLNTLNSTRIAPTMTTKPPDTTNPRVTHSFQRPAGASALKDYKDTPPKPVVVESFPVNAARPNTTLIPRRKQKVRTTTEATPYDAIDADYYNNYEAADESSRGKGTVEDEARDSDTTSNEYSEDYESVTTGKLKTKKKTKQTSASSIRKSHPALKSFRRAKDPRLPKVDEDEDDEETADDEGSTAADVKSVPIAAQLSKNLEAALVNMMKQSLEKRKNEKAPSSLALRNAGSRELNASSVERSAKGLKTVNTENWSLRPYYGFEGPMIVGLSEDSHLGGQVEKTGETGSGKVREFKFIGKKMRENLPLKNQETGKFVANQTRRQMKSDVEPGNKASSGNGMAGVSMPGLPLIQPNDPNSLVQLGRYFKNKFAGYEPDASPNAERVDSDDLKSPVANSVREDRLSNEQRRYGMAGANGRPRLRYRPRPGSREDEWRRKSRPGAWEKQRRLVQESDPNYYEARRLYPRGYDFYETSVTGRVERRNDESWGEAQDRLGVAWPDKNSNSDVLGYDEPSEVVSPRTFLAPIRTTRSFHDEPTQRDEPARVKPFPDFRLSKLVKEVKIDLDQRLLRKYLEGFAKKIVKKDTTTADDWKGTWRQLLGQMLGVLDKMNVNVNGDVMKVRVGSDERENKLTPSLSVEHSKKLEWKSGLRKQRKDSINSGISVQSPNLVTKKINENTTARDTNLPSEGQSRRVSPNSLQADSARMKDSKVGEEVTTDSPRKSAYSDTVTKSSIVEKNVGHSLKLELPGSSLISRANRVQEEVRSRNDDRSRNVESKTSSHRDEKTARPTVDQQFGPRQFGNGLQRTNWFRPGYTNFNNSQMVLAPARSVIPQISTVYGYQPVIPQLHHRILFPGWSGIRVLDRINPPADKSAPSKGRYLPKGTLSRIVGSEHKNEHFGVSNDRSDGSGAKHDSRTPTTATPRADSNNGLPRSNDSSNTKMGSERANEPLTKDPRMEYRENELWRRIEGEDGRNEVRNIDSSVYSSNERYLNESDISKLENKQEDTRDDSSLGDDEANDDDPNLHEDYEQKPVWSPAHHLTKALELSLLRKFGANPPNSLRSKNLVTRSAENLDVDRVDTHANGGYTGRRGIEEKLEELHDEPSIVSLRMIMDPNEGASSRMIRQSQDSRVLERKPRTVELRLQFSGKEETATTLGEEIDYPYRVSSGNQQNSRNNQTFGDSSAIELDSNEQATKIRPLGFNDKNRRRALMNRLRERSRHFHLSYPRTFPRRGENATVISNLREKLATRMLSPRDRKSRTTALGGRNIRDYGNSSKNFEGVKHHIATVVRRFDGKKLEGRERAQWRRNGPYGKDSGVDWTGQAASLFTDLKENSDEFTLYIDLTLGRVGSKTSKGWRSRG